VGQGRLRLEAETLRSELPAQVEEFGFSPPQSEKSKRLIGAAFAFTLTTSSTTDIRDAEVERLREACEPSIFRKLFLEVKKYKLAAGAATLLASTLPEGAPRNPRMLFSHAVHLKDGPARLKIEKLRQRRQQQEHNCFPGGTGFRSDSGRSGDRAACCARNRNELAMLWRREILQIGPNFKAKGVC
jgi:hypothetical protein